MPFVLLALGILFLVVSIKGTQGDLFALLQSEFTGSNSFIIWASALIILGLLAYIKPIRPVVHAFMALIVLVLLLANHGHFFSQFNQAIRNPATPPPPQPSNTGSNAQAAAPPSTGFLGSAVPDILSSGAASGPA
jgi:hypothetical protein